MPQEVSRAGAMVLCMSHELTRVLPILFCPLGAHVVYHISGDQIVGDCLSGLASLVLDRPLTPWESDRLLSSTLTIFTALMRRLHAQDV